MGTDLFFPAGAQEPDPEAVALCRRCPVQQECLAAGIEGREWGVWGGMSEAQRRALTRTRGRAKCPRCNAYPSDPTVILGGLPEVDEGRVQVCPSCGLSWRGPASPSRASALEMSS